MVIVHRLRTHPRLVDCGIVLFLVVANLAASLRVAHPQIAEGLLGTADTLPLLGWRRFPIAATIAVTAGTLAMIAVGVWVLPLALGVALYTLTSERDSATTRLVSAGVVVSVAVAVTIAGGFEFGAGAARVVFLITAALLGITIRSHRAYVAEIEQKAERLERERDSEARRAAAEEQARIAREIHDVVAHALSVIVVQAGAADDAFEHDPSRVRAPLRAIDAAARSALADLRRVLGTLEHPDAYEPQPGLARIGELIDRVRAAGLDVSLTVDGSKRTLPAAVDLSAYRIVQEALTNSLKHAYAEHVEVRIRYDDVLGLEVTDDGRGVGPGLPTGNGLVGMRERVALLGGELSVGPRSNGGYGVAAQLPIDAQ